MNNDKTPQNSKNTDTNVEGLKRKNNNFEAVPAPSNINLRKNLNRNNVKYIIKSNSARKSLKAGSIILIILVLAFSAGWLGSLIQENKGFTFYTAKEIVTSQNQVVAAIAKNVNPSVVSIDAIGSTTTQSIFGDTSSSPSESQGTGIIISSNGYIITNRHVIPDGTTSVKITLYDGTTINNVKVVGSTNSTDPLDLAFLKINNSPETLQPALLGNSNNIQIGDTVVAIGNALGQFQNTVTSGIISGRGRTIQAGSDSSTSSEDLQDLIQTDAAINPGNSGGPLININGEVIGINTALASNGAQNIGFSIPINDAMGLIKSVINTGTIERPYLGVYYLSINPAVAKQYGISVTNGAYIPKNSNGQNSIISGSPAANAGLQQGDVILAVNSVKIDTNNTLSSLIDKNPVGTKLTLTVLRNGNRQQLQITVGQEPSN